MSKIVVFGIKHDNENTKWPAVGKMSGDYFWQLPDMHKIKTTLNKVKAALDTISESDRDDFDKFNDRQRGVNALRGHRGILAAKYGAEVVTNAWLKLFEIMFFLYTHKIATDKIDKNGAVVKVPAAEFPNVAGVVYHSFHFAEAPGNFILAVNHFLATIKPTMEWSWMANSLRSLYEGGHARPLDDKYGLIAANRESWRYGAEGDGDITSPANLRSFAQDVDDIWGGSIKPANRTGAHLVTADVKFVPAEGFNWDEEETFNVPVQAGQIIAALFTLQKGGGAILKEFTLFSAASISLTWLFNLCFDHIWIIKPVASRPTNSEIYLVGGGFKGQSVIDSRKDALLAYMTTLRKWAADGSDVNAGGENMGPPALFAEEDIPPEFINSLLRVEDSLAKRQSAALTTLTTKWAAKNETDLTELTKDAQAWIDFNKIKQLPANRKLVNL
jgi:hypothetical protein